MTSAREIKAVAKILSDPENAELTAEEVAEKAIEAYETEHHKSHNLIVLGHFRLDDDTSYVAAVGPLSTRAVMRARDVGERFAWDYKTRTGTGKYVLVPLVRDPRDAWDDARRASLQEFEHHLTSITPGVDPSYEAMRFEIPDARRAEITAEWQMDPEIMARVSAAACTCGLKGAVCHRHPEGREGDRA